MLMQQLRVESEIGIGLKKKRRDEVRRTMDMDRFLDQWRDPFDVESTIQEVLFVAEDPFSIGLHFQGCKYANDVGELCHVKRDKPIPLTIEGINGPYLIGLVHTNPTKKACKIVAKDSSGSKDFLLN